MADQSTPETDFDSIELIPAEDEDVLTPDEELAALIDPDDIPFVEVDSSDDTAPIGRTWLYNFEDDGFGTTAQPVSDITPIVMVAQVALRTKRLQHEIFPDDFGMEDPDVMIGRMDDPELRAFYMHDVEDTLLAAHDRITGVGDFLWLRDEDDEIAYMDATLEIDGDINVRLEGVPLGTQAWGG